ncbi:hypothetical protein MN608_02911 [Microdochium nivale]|nr:hypothetical protein MN608_02911 [Microdochium nivale]
MAPQGLRVVAVVSFVPAFPLLLTHGILSRSAVPATGLVPLAFSAGFSLFILRRRSRHAGTTTVSHDGERENNERQPLLPSEEAGFVPPSDAIDDDHQDSQQHGSNATASAIVNVHERFPFLVFLADMGLAAAILTVLVYTWLGSSHLSAQLAMLAAYGTMPLLASTLTHIYFAVRGLSHGLALPELTRWVAWQVVPGDCPGCGHHLRPRDTPEVPWLQSARDAAASTRRWRFPALPAVTLPSLGGWTRRGTEDDDDDDDAEAGAAIGVDRSTSKGASRWLRRPAWLGYGAVDQARDGERDEDDEEARFLVDRDDTPPLGHRDEDEDANHRRNGGTLPAPPPREVAALAGSAEEVVVVGKRKQRRITSPSEDPLDEPSWSF